MEAKGNKLGYMPMGRLLLSVSAPLMVSMLVQSLYNIVDGIYVSRISEAALTATSLSGPMQGLIIGFGVGTSVGVNSLVSRRLGEKRQGEANLAAAHGYLLAFLTYILFLLAGLFAVKPFFTMFTDDPVLQEMGFDYLSVCLRASFGIFIAFISERLLQASGRTGLSMVSQMSGAITNILMDPVFIFGVPALGIPAMGVQGAAVATVLGQWVSAVVSTVLCLKFNKDIKITFRGFKFRPDIVRSIYAVGVPSIVMQAVGTVCNLLLNSILISYSATAVAVQGVYFKMDSFVFMPIFGLTQGLVPIIGYNYGARNKERISKAFRLSMIIAITIMTLGMTCFQLFPRQLLSIFNAEGEMLEMGIMAMRSVSLNFIMAGATVVMTSVCTGMGVGYPSLITSLARQVFLHLPAAYLLASNLGVQYTWYAWPISESISVIIAIVLVRHIYKRKMAEISTKETETVNER